MALQMGTLFTAEEALKISLVDKVVGNREECLDTAHTVVSSLASIPSEVNKLGFWKVLAFLKSCFPSRLDTCPKC